MRTTVVAQAGTLPRRVRRHRARRPGRFRFDVLNGSGARLLAAAQGSSYFDGTRLGPDSLFAALWDAAHDDRPGTRIRTATSPTSPSLMDFAVRGDLGRLGRDDPATPRREMPFAYKSTSAPASSRSIWSRLARDGGPGRGRRLAGGHGHYDGVAPERGWPRSATGPGSAATLTEATTRRLQTTRGSTLWSWSSRLPSWDYVYGRDDGARSKRDMYPLGLT